MPECPPPDIDDEEGFVEFTSRIIASDLRDALEFSDLQESFGDGLSCLKGMELAATAPPLYQKMRQRFASGIPSPGLGFNCRNIFNEWNLQRSDFISLLGRRN